METPARPLAPVPPSKPSNRINVGKNERIASVVGGGLLAIVGLSRASLGGLLTAATGGALLWRGTTGHCPAFAALGKSTAETDAPVQPAQGRAPKPVEIREAVTVAQPRDEVYNAWRDYERLPTMLKHLESVTVTDKKHSTWTVRIPKGAGTFSYEAETIHEEPGERIAWRSVEGSSVHNAGEVVLRDGPAEGMTEMLVSISYRAPAAAAGHALASLLNPAFSQMVKEDIRRFKNTLEAGEVPTIEGQPRGA